MKDGRPQDIIIPIIGNPNRENPRIAGLGDAAKLLSSLARGLGFRV